MAEETNTPKVTVPEAPAKTNDSPIVPENKVKRGRKKAGSTKNKVTKTAAKDVKEAAESPAKTAVRADPKTVSAKKSVATKAEKAAKKESSQKKPSKNTSLNELKSKVIYQFEGKNFSENDFVELVKGYIKDHPYISANEIEVFVKPGDNKVYFTINGYNNEDFHVEIH